MKIIVGVESDRQYESALSLLARLQFANNDYLSAVPTDKSAIPVSQPHTHLLPGASSVLTSVRRGPAVMEKPVDEDSSYLVWNDQSASLGPVRCVFATDHSPYCAGALDEFLSLDPAGIEEMTVFTAIETTTRMIAASLHRHLSDGTASILDVRSVAERGADLVLRIEARGIKSTSRLRTGHVPHLIDAAMKETDSELLIIGARGQGENAPMSIGSIASSMIQCANYPVLVLRA